MAKSDPTIQISVTIRQSVHAQLSERAQRMDRSLSWLLNHAAEAWLSTNPLEPDARSVSSVVSVPTNHEE